MRGLSALLIHSGGFGWPAVHEALDQISVHIIGDAMTADEAIQLTIQHQPNLTIASSRLADESSLPTLAKLRQFSSPASELIVFIAPARELSLIELMELVQLHPCGILTWRETTTVDAVRYALKLVLFSDTTAVSNSIRDTYVEAVRGDPARGLGAIEFDNLELSVLRRRAAGLSYAEIARAEGVSERTIERKFAVLRDKLDASDQFNLAVKATLLGLIP